MQIVLIRIDGKNGDPALTRKLCYFFKEEITDEFIKTIPLADNEFVAITEAITVEEFKQYTMDEVIDSLRI